MRALRGSLEIDVGPSSRDSLHIALPWAERHLLGPGTLAPTGAVRPHRSLVRCGRGLGSPNLSLAAVRFSRREDPPHGVRPFLPRETIQQPSCPAWCTSPPAGVGSGGALLSAQSGNDEHFSLNAVTPVDPTPLVALGSPDVQGRPWSNSTRGRGRFLSPSRWIPNRGPSAISTAKYLDTQECPVGPSASARVGSVARDVRRSSKSRPHRAVASRDAWGSGHPRSLRLSRRGAPLGSVDCWPLATITRQTIGGMPEPVSAFGRDRRPVTSSWGAHVAAHGWPSRAEVFLRRTVPWGTQWGQSDRPRGSPTSFGSGGSSG